MSLRRFVKDSDVAEEENLPLSGMIVRDRRLVPIYPTSGMRYPPIIVALSRDLESNLSIRWKGTWYPIAPSASERDSTSRHFSSNFHESVASACWRTSERAYYTKCFPSVFSAWYYPDVERSRKKRAGKTRRWLFLSQRRRERKGHGGSCYSVNEASDTSADDVYEQVVIDRPR